MSDKLKWPSSEEPKDNSQKKEELKLSLEQKKQKLEQQKNFNKLSNAHDTLSTKIDSRSHITDLQKDLLKTELDTKQKATDSYPQIEDFIAWKKSQSSDDYIIPPSGMTQSQENSIHSLAWAKESIVQITQTCVDIGKWACMAIPDAWAIYKWEATYEQKV